MPTNKFIKELGEELEETGVANFRRDEGRFMYANSAFLEIFGVDKEQLEEDPSVLLRLFSAEDLDYVRRQYDTYSKSGHFRNIEMKLSFPGGHQKHLSCDAIMLEDGKFILLFIKDITKRFFREEYVIRNSAQKDTLLDMLTHNLSGPLFLSKDILSEIKKGVGDQNNKSIHRMISMLQENTEHCLDIVNDFLQKEHFESMRIFVTRTRFDAIEKINVTLEKLREMNKEKTLLLTSASNTLPVYSDSVKFFQVIHNILSNSVKYTAPDGIIEIHVKDEEETFLVSVKDNGIGISDDIQKHIFSQRVNGLPGLLGEKSSGLGLSIAKKLVDMLDGELWFESKVKEGAKFYIRLPK